MILPPRFYKVLSDLWSNKVRSLLVIASISVGLFAVGIIGNLRVLLPEAMRNSYASVHSANIRMAISPFSDSLLVEIRKIKGIRLARGVTRSSMRVRTAIDTWSAIDMIGLHDFDQPMINQVTLLAGKWPPGKGEIAVERNKFSELNASLGDWIEIKLDSGRSRKLHLVGIVHDQTVGASGIGGGYFLAPIQGYITDDTLPHLELPQRYTHLELVATGDTTNLNHIKTITEKVRNRVEDAGYSIISVNQRGSDQHPNVIYVEAMSNILLFLGLFIVFLSGFLVTNTISALISQQVQQVGIMKTVGARRIQIISIYMMVILVYGVLACLIAIPFSNYATQRILNFLAEKINFDLQGFTVVPATIVFQVLIALLVPQIAGFLPIYNAARISAYAAMSGSHTGKPTKRKTWFNRRRARMKNISRPLILSIRNTFRRKGRLILTLITLSLGGAVFISTFNVRSSLNQHIRQISKYFLADVNLTLDRPYRIDRIQSELITLEGIAQVEGWSQARAELVLADGTVGESVNLMAPPADSKLVQPILIKGRWIYTEDENAIVLSELFLSLSPKINVGDTIQLNVNGQENDFVVVGFFRLAGKSGGYLAYANYDYFSKLIHQKHKAAIYRIVSSTPNLSEKAQKELGQNVEAHLIARGYIVQDISAGSYLINASSKGLGVLTVFLLIMASLIALVGSIGLAGTMSMNVLERTREIGILRAIGASDRSLSRMVIIEGLFIGLISWFFGTWLSFPMSKVMNDSINMVIFDVRSEFALNVLGLFVWLAVVLLLSVAASLMPARNASRLTIREVLAYE